MGDEVFPPIRTVDYFRSQTEMDKVAKVMAYYRALDDDDRDDDWSEDFERYMTETGWLQEDER